MASPAQKYCWSKARQCWVWCQTQGAGSSCCVLAAAMLQSTCREPFCLCWHLTAPQHFREDSHCTLSPLWQGITYSYWTYLWSFLQCFICFLDQVNFPVFLLWPGEKQTSPAPYIIVDIWIICLQTRTRLLSEMGYQITEIWWHTTSFPISTHPVYSEQITCKKIDFYYCSWISSHFLISWTAAPSPDLSAWNILAQSR